MKYLAIIQARMSSSRLPGKVMQEINGIPSIKFQIDRLQKAKIDSIVVATSTHESDDELVDYLTSLNVDVRRGSLDDVADRFLNVLHEYKPDNFLRLTADCPLVMPLLVNEMLDVFEADKTDYLSNTAPPTFPDGLDVEIVNTDAFTRLISSGLTDFEREHVTLGFKSRLDDFSLRNFESSSDLSDFRWTIDYPEDLEYIRSLAKYLHGKESVFTFQDILAIIESHPKLVNRIGSEFRNIALRSFGEGSGEADE